MGSEKLRFWTDTTYGENQDTRIEFDYTQREDLSDLTVAEQLYGSNLIMLTGINIEQKNAANAYQKIRKTTLYSAHPGDANSTAHRQLASVQHCGYVGSSESCYVPIQIGWKEHGTNNLPRYVNKVTGSLGASTRFEVTTLAKNSTTGRFTERPFGEGTLPTGTTDILERMPNLTTAIHRDNGIGGVSTTRYAYQGNGIDDAGERGFLGFFAQRIIDEQSGNITYLKKRLDFPLVGKVAESVTYHNNALLSKQDLPAPPKDGIDQITDVRVTILDSSP